MGRRTERSIIKSNRLKEIISLMQQGEITTSEIMKKYKVSASMVRFDIALFAKGIEINKISRGGKKVYYSITQEVDFDNLQCLKEKRIVTNAETLRKVTIGEIKEKIEADILGKKTVCRTGLLDWFCKTFEGRHEIQTGELVKLVNSYGVKVVNV